MSEDPKLVLIKELVEAAETSIKSAKKLLKSLVGDTGKKDSSKAVSDLASNLDDHDEEGNVVEGVFTGDMMIGKNKKEYPVPANYASKSKLVPGDVLKLTVKDDGSFLYKQIGPVERKRVIGILTYEDGQYKVTATGKAYKVLLASVTYFKGEVGDKVTIVVAEDIESEWGAIENILPQSEDDINLE